MKTHFIFAVCLLTPMSLAHALSIQNVSHSPKYIDTTKNESVKIQYATDQKAQVTLRIFDDRDLLVKKISSKGSLAAGMHEFVWDGSDQTRQPVPAEAYRYTLVAESGKDKVEHDLSDMTGGYSVAVSQVTWDKASQTLQYSILKPARVSVRVGLKDNGPLMATLVDWQPKTFGTHTLRWNGMDNSGVVDVGKIGNYDIHAQAFALSENTILVGPESGKINLIQNMKWPEEKRVRKQKTAKQMKMHSQQYAEKRGDFVIEIMLPANLKKTADGVPIVSSVTPVRFKLSLSDQLRIANDRYEPILFIDGKFQTENEVGFFPMTWNWDPKDLAEGEHYLTVNLRGYEGHYGAANVKVYVKH